MPLKRHADRGDLHYSDRFLVIDIDSTSRQEREETLRGVVRRRKGWEIAVKGQLEEEFADIDIDRVTEHLDIIVVDDPIAAAKALTRRPGVTASPIHALGFSWHSPMTATTHRDAPRGTVFPQVHAGHPDRIIALVDTGIVDPGTLPDWMSSSVICGKSDLEELTDKEPSHGTFVSSLLRQIAPTHTVSMARAGAVGTGDERSRDHPKPDPTTELHVADAIYRLIDRHQDGSSVEALNLAIGGPAAPSMVMLALEKAISSWRQAFPGTPVFAAAGNTPETDEIFPAAFRYVRGVAAAAQGGGQIVWRGDTVDDAPDRQWVDDVAPGADLIGLSGRSPDDAISWSGSSFATAVATASHVNGGPLDVRRGVAYWPNRRMTYGDVPGLKFN